MFLYFYVHLRSTKRFYGIILFYMLFQESEMEKNKIQDRYLK